MSKPTARAQGLLNDLLHIEVDIIVSDDLDRGPMPAPSAEDPDSAIRDVLATYDAWLDRHGPALDQAWASSGVEHDVVTVPISRSAPRSGDLGDELRGVEERAASLEVMVRELAIADQLPDPTWPHMLRRIRGNAAQLRAVATGEVAGQVDKTRIVRKAWELGTHTIVAQTVVQLDGDVILRSDEDAFLTADREPLRKMRAAALRGALEHWRMLFGLVIQLAMTTGQLVRAFWPPRVGLARLKERWRDRRQRDRGQELTVRDLMRKKTWTTIRADWNDFRETVVALLIDGGATIESPDGGPPAARTVIQPDGDAMWFVSADAANDRALLDAHTSRVAAWYERSGTAVAAVQQIAAAFQRAAAGLLAVLGAVLAIVKSSEWSWWALGAGAAMAVVGALLFRAGLGRWIRKAVGLARG
jgi:hypothetical protein